ncbi:unnamed protein product, partial [Closterium sp. Naga37s-1]
MPLFLTEEELQAVEGDVRAVARKAEEQIGSLLRQLETHKAQADAAEINAEQTCSLIEQKYLAVTDENAQLEREKGFLTADLDQKAAELAEIKAQVHRLQLEGIQGDGERERLKAELAEAQTSRRDLVDVIERKNLEIDEKNASLKSYLDKIVSLTDSRTELEGRLRKAEAEASRWKAAVNRHVQEKEILEQHLAWLREDVAGKAGALQEERRARAEGEAELRSKLLGAEHERDDLRAAESRAQARVAELQGMVAQLQKEVKKRAEEEALHESQLAAELETAKKLVELYKESAAEAGERAADLKGVVKSLEDHLKQVEDEGESRFKAAEEAARKQQQELQRRCEELQKSLEEANKKAAAAAEAAAAAAAAGAGGLELVPAAATAGPIQPLDRQLAAVLHGGGSVPPSLPQGVTGVALATYLVKDGWTMATMYEKYEEAADAWRHERQQRRQAETLLNRVLREIEQKAGVVLEERELHARMARAYDVMQDKLALAADQQAAVEASLAECRAELRARERDVSLLSTDVADLQSQVTVLLKELRDVSRQHANNEATAPPTPPRPSSSDFVSVEQLTITDIGGLVQANTSLRHALRKLQDDYSSLEPRIKARFEEELERRAAANAKEVERVVGMYKEQEELAQRHKAAHDMFKMLYDEQQQRMRAMASGTAAASPHPTDSPAAKGTRAVPMLSSPPPDGPDYKTLYTATQEELERLRQDRKQHMDELQEALDAARKVASESRMERMRAEAEAQFTKQQAEALEKTLEEERKVKDAAVARSSEFAASVTAHQRQLRDAERLLAAAEEKATRATIEASVLEREKALLAAAEERATAEAGSALERMHRVQAAHDSLESTQAAREATWAAERKRLEGSIDRMQREWAEASRALEAERDHSRHLVEARDRAAADAAQAAAQRCCHPLVEALKASRALEAERDHSRHLVEARDRAAADAEAKLSAAWKDVEQLKQQLSAAVTKAKTAEARCEELQAGVKRLEAVAAAAVAGGAGGGVGGRSLRSASVRDAAAAAVAAAASAAAGGGGAGTGAGATGGAGAAAAGGGAAGDAAGGKEGESMEEEEVEERLHKAEEEVQRLKEELEASQGYLAQYKAIGKANEEALERMMQQHSSFKEEAEKERAAAAAVAEELRGRVKEAEKRAADAAAAATGLTEEHERAFADVSRKLEAAAVERDAFRSRVEEIEWRVESEAKEASEMRQKWREAQTNYERQVVLQADTIRQLDGVSQTLNAAQAAQREWRSKAEKAEAELTSLRAEWETVKGGLEAARAAAEGKAKEVPQPSHIPLPAPLCPSSRPSVLPPFSPPTTPPHQVVLQADTIRQLDGVSQTLNAAQAAQREWRSKAEKAEAELTSLRAEWETVKGGLEAARAAAEGKAKEVEAQNVILLDRLEALRVGTPGKAGGVASPGVGRRRSVASPSPGKAGRAVGGTGAAGGETAAVAAAAAEGEGEGEGEGGVGEDGGLAELQEVVRFLRRSKEASEMELALLKQERLRLTKQIEAAEREAQEAQQQLREVRARGAATAQSEGEFAALKAQVAQVNLLRESNAMLRDESQRNFADAGEWREKARQAQQQVGPLQAAVQRREAEVAAGKREVESAREEVGRWQRRVQQLLEKYKAIDVEEYQRLQDQLQVKECFGLLEKYKAIDVEEYQRLQDQLQVKECFGLLEKYKAIDVEEYQRLQDQLQVKECFGLLEKYKAIDVEEYQRLQDQLQVKECFGLLEKYKAIDVEEYQRLQDQLQVKECFGLLEKYKAIDVEEYQRLQDQLQVKEKYKAIDVEEYQRLQDQLQVKECFGLLEKYKAIDVEEYQRLQDQLQVKECFGLLEKYKAIDVEEYQRLQDQLQVKEKYKAIDVEEYQRLQDQLQVKEKYKAIDVEEYQRLQDQLQVKEKQAEQLEQELSEARGALAAAKAAAEAAEKDKETEKKRAAAELAKLEAQRAALAEEKEKLEKDRTAGGEELKKQLEAAKENEAKHKTEFAKLRNTAIKFKRNGEQLSKEKEELRQAKEQQSKEAEAAKTKAAELEKRIADLEKRLQTASESSQKRVADLEKRLQEQTAAGAAARKAEEGKSAAEAASGKQQAAMAEGILNSRIQLLQRQLAAEKERRTKNLKSIVDSFQRAKESYETISVRVVAVEDWIKQQRQ